MSKSIIVLFHGDKLEESSEHVKTFVVSNLGMSFFSEGTTSYIGNYGSLISQPSVKIDFADNLTALYHVQGCIKMIESFEGVDLVLYDPHDYI